MLEKTIMRIYEQNLRVGYMRNREYIDFSIRKGGEYDADSSL